MIQERLHPHAPANGGDVVEELRARGFTVMEAEGEVLTAGDLLSILSSGVAQGIIDPDKPLKLEDPNLTHPWEVRRALVEGDEVVLDVWGD